jgi:hypothetical protein
MTEFRKHCVLLAEHMAPVGDPAEDIDSIKKLPTHTGFTEDEVATALTKARLLVVAHTSDFIEKTFEDAEVGAALLLLHPDPRLMHRYLASVAGLALAERAKAKMDKANEDMLAFVDKTYGVTLPKEGDQS